MIKPVLTAALLTLVLALPVLSQMEPVKRTAEFDKLNFLVGEWKAHGKMEPGPLGPGGEWEGSSSIHWALGDVWLMQEHKSEMPGLGAFYGHGMTTYDAETGKYISYWFDNMITKSWEYHGNFDEKGNVVSTIEAEWQGMKFHERQTWIKNDDGSFVMLSEMSMDGKTYTKTMEILFTKRE